MRTKLFALLVLPFLGACGFTTVERNQACIQTRFGDVVNNGELLDPGFKAFIVSRTRCFDMREQTFPDEESEGERSVTMRAQTNDPLTVTGDVTVVYRFRPGSALEIYDTKGTEEALERELYAAISEGYRNGVVQYSVDELFSGKRTELDKQVQQFIQAKIGRETGLVEILSVFIRNIEAPEEIERLRTQASSRDQMLDQERKQFQIDSIAAIRRVVNAQAFADSVRLEANAYASNPALLQLRATEAFANGMAEICSGTSTCIVGGNVLDKFLTSFNSNSLFGGGR